MWHTPTITAALTQAGVIMGTAAYMSPEQAKGRSVDRRADIWSYGAVIYELLVGRRLFQGESATETMAEVMKTEIDWESLPDDTPETLRRLLMRCLDRNPVTRLRDIGEARIALEDLRAGRTDETDAAGCRAGGPGPGARAPTLACAAPGVVGRCRGAYAAASGRSRTADGPVDPTCLLLVGTSSPRHRSP